MSEMIDNEKMTLELSEEDLLKVSGGVGTINGSDKLSVAQFTAMCNYFGSGNGYVVYEGKRLRVCYYTFNSSKNGGGSFKQFKLVFPDGSKRIVQADSCRLIVK